MTELDDAAAEYYADLGAEDGRLPLRAACEHGRYEKHNVRGDEVIWPLEPCPGGQDITIDHDAGGRMFDAITSGHIDAEDNTDSGASRLIFAAAIGKDSGNA